MSLDALKNKARKAILAAKYDVALKCYLDIHKEDPADLRIYTKLAEMKEKTGDLKGAVADYTNIAKAYADDGFIVQAIAINKLILRLDPEQTEIKEKLKNLSTERGEDWALNTIISADIAQKENNKNLDFERTPLLSGLSGEELDDFIDSLELKEVSTGTTIYCEGDPGENLYLIGMGKVYLETKDSHGKTHVFSQLKEGDFFGEIAFMSNKPQSDTSIAETDVNLLIISRKVFNEWVEKHPDIHQTVEDFYKRRVLARILAITPVFEAISNEARVALAQQFSLSFFKDGEHIIKEGDMENTFYLIRSGQVKVVTTNKKDTSKTIELDTLGEGSFFGEVSILTKMPRTATVTAQGDVEVMTLTGDKFLAIAKQHPTIKQVVETYLKQRVMSTIKKLKT
jgi:CRP-like cAMP-binding protein